MTTVIVDNYDSFSYNLFQAVGAVDPDVIVVRNDAVTPEGLLELDPDSCWSWTLTGSSCPRAREGPRTPGSAWRP